MKFATAVNLRRPGVFLYLTRPTGEGYFKTRALPERYKVTPMQERQNLPSSHPERQADRIVNTPAAADRGNQIHTLTRWWDVSERDTAGQSGTRSVTVRTKYTR